MGSTPVWKGLHGDLCVLCREGGTLLCCDYCPMAYHMQPCLGLMFEPNGLWACPGCLRRVAEARLGGGRSGGGAGDKAS
ncbi:unnamed protein product [Phaeothamnion confervicola]